MMRLILAILIFLCTNYTYANSDIKKRNAEDINCLIQFEYVEKNPSNENIRVFLDYLMVNTSYSKLSLITINHCASELKI
ncbi:MAG: hypothetical protein ACK45U_07005 [bacterium]